VTAAARGIDGSTNLTAVIGSPVTHSLSPALHNAAFEAAGLNWRFVAFEVAPGGAAAAIDAMSTLGIRGYAVTMPHKADVAATVDAVDPAAAALGSVNTVVLNDDRSTFGASTDGAGFVASTATAGVDLEGMRVVVLGAGGAARSIIDALGRTGVADIAIVNRTSSSAEDAARLAVTARVGEPVDVEHAGLLVNATSIGMGTHELAVDRSVLRPDLAVADIVYHPLETALLSAARAVGALVIDGLGMLVHQAALQQQLWTGQLPDPALMRAAAEAELEARSE
jgi:shikimate dehydrogenase